MLQTLGVAFDWAGTGGIAMNTSDSTADGATGPGRLPAGIGIQPRQFRFEALDSIPRHWIADNPIVTHFENTFSLLIPPGERFFIRSVRALAERADGPELAAQIRAFVSQESFHMAAHDDFNRSFARFGVDVAREEAYGEVVMQRLTRVLPKRVALGATAFLEHLTATGAHLLFSEPEIAARMHPETLRFWRWHAAEELEHKAVAFDLLRACGGGYLLRIFSAFVALALLAYPFAAIARRQFRADPTPITPAMRREARALQRQINRTQTRLLLDYFKPGFHPWQCRDDAYLRAWYASGEAPVARGRAA